MEGKEEDVRLGANKFSEHQWPTAVDGAAAMAGRKGTPPTRSAHSRICYPSAHGHWCCRRLADPPNPFALVCTPPPTSATTQPTARIYRNTATNQHHSTAPIHRCYRNHGARGGQILLPIPPKITHEPLSHDGSTSWRPFPTAKPSEIEQFCVLGDRRTGERTEPSFGGACRRLGRARRRPPRNQSVAPCTRSNNFALPSRTTVGVCGFGEAARGIHFWIASLLRCKLEGLFGPRVGE